MFLPETVNQDKLNTNFDYNKSRENFFIFFFQVPFYSFILGLVLLISLFLIYRKIKFSAYFSFASLIFYISFLVIAFPSMIIFNHSLSGNTFGVELSIFLIFYGAGYIIAILLGLVAFLLLFLYSLRIKEC
ncbi:hypothetical protein KF201_0977 [Lactococcus lactis subsp. lactis]|nr:hypothetical protein KF201_0977 [Lactococcus lactis subsp. lactis]